MKIIVCGDVHCNWGQLNTLINNHKPDIILQCGDFGWWPHIHNKYWNKEDTKRYNQYGIKNKNTIIYWCDGNHENHEDIIIQKNNNIFDFVGNNIIYQPRGSIITLPDNRTVLFFGGAMSIDKNRRVEGSSWWRQELPTLSDMYYMEEQLLKLNRNIDIVISHTAPSLFIKQLGHMNGKERDSTCQFLDFILNNYNPKYWYFGHFHRTKNGYDKGCKWFALNCIPNGGWWKII